MPVFAERSVLAARSTSPLSAGAIAGAVVGSVVGVLIILLCLFPFARRRWINRHDENTLAEMGQSPGGPNFTHPDDDSTKKYSKDHLVPGSDSQAGTAHEQPIHGSTDTNGQTTTSPTKTSLDQLPSQPTLPQGVSLDQGLPSPISPSASPSPRSESFPGQAQTEGQAVSASAAAGPIRSPTSASSKSRSASKGTTGKDSTRQLNLDSSFVSPSRQGTFTNIVEEPESFEPPSQRSTFREKLTSIFRTSSGEGRRDSKRSTGTRSSSLLTDPLGFQELVPGQPLGQPIIEEHHPDPSGLNWGYYNDPTLPPGSDALPQGTELSQYSGPVIYSEPGTFTTIPNPADLTFVPPATYAPTSVLPSPVSPGQQPSFPGLGLDITSPDSDQTVTPINPLQSFSQRNRVPGPLQRVDSLPPPTIVSDIPSPPFNYTAGPSGNPMDFMNPTNQVESAWMVEQEILKAENSPSPPALSPPTDTFPRAMAQEPQLQYIDQNHQVQYINGAGLSPEPEYNFGQQHLGQQNIGQQHLGQQNIGQQNLNLNQQQNFVEQSYQSPPYQPSYQQTPEMGVVQDFGVPLGYYNGTMIQDYSTPPPSGPSLPSTVQNTPDTRLTAYTASPSPPSELEPHNGMYLNVSPIPSPGQSPQPSSSALSPGLSPIPSPGLSAPSPATSAGLSPGGQEKAFACNKCDRVFDQIHKLNHHKRYHDRPHECHHAGCTMRFGTKTHLDRHINDKHFKTRKFYCTVHDCPYSKQGGKSFPRKDNWRRHMVNKHQLTPTTDPEPEFIDEVMVGV
ncbi:hypothetical protein QBC41DRAFT_153513 [Cercophora samala]|uniref:C2H2-type domain-containing protein n=1 Tax=Cercophora samala TaxID=330535 RepID=A0AA40DAF9_9PEZI|nr:hypothetical protein QBC41DRAFT_153513 [Cercophora samala]